ncbi:HXXEE domain-containing protein [Bifidobacterium sp.]|uniref:HXXEE domain-containing protein n=1 Tax=Bifidobacterium sp. TaxID=41200 RepID=UPI0039E7D83E
MEMFLSYWMLPILFILHDFEEMIAMPIWKRRHRRMLSTMSKPFFGAVSNGQAFSCGVLEEMTILLVVSAICSVTNDSTLYLAFCIAYASHFIMHYRMCMQMRAYVPGVVSATIEMPVMIWLIISYWHMGQATLETFLAYQAVVLLFVYANLLIMHRLMPAIQSSLLAYANDPA